MKTWFYLFILFSILSTMTWYNACYQMDPRTQGLPITSSLRPEISIDPEVNRGFMGVEILYTFPDLDEARILNVLTFTQEGLHEASDGRLYILVYVGNKVYRLYLEEEPS